MIERFVGMFAFALWDRAEKTLHLARDRMGEKPLYYGWCGKSFLFGSELKSLRAHPDWKGEISADALALYMKLGCVPGPYSIYRGIHKLPPASILSLQHFGSARASTRTAHVLARGRHREARIRRQTGALR